MFPAVLMDILLFGRVLRRAQHANGERTPENNRNAVDRVSGDHARLTLQYSSFRGKNRQNTAGRNAEKKTLPGVSGELLYGG